MNTTFVNKLRVNYDLEFNRIHCKVCIPKRVGQKVIATFDDCECTIIDCGKYASVQFWASTKQYEFFGVCIRDLINNRLKYQLVIDMASRRASYELLRALS